MNLEPRKVGTLAAVAAGVLLIALTAAVFWPSLKGEFIWGDDLYITQNPLVKEPGGLADMWLSFRKPQGDPRKLPQYYPLTFTTFWVEWRCWGQNPAPYHVANILLHGLGAVLLWRLLRRLSVPGAWFTAAIFAIHPIHVDSVTWISERVNTLSGVFFLASFLLYLRQDERGGWLAYVASLLLFVLALLSKTTVVVLPAMLVMVRWWQRRPWTIGAILRLVPFFALSLRFAWITIGYEKVQVGAKLDASFVERCLLAGRITWLYVAQLVWPKGLAWHYPLWDIHARNLSAWLPAAGLAVLAVALAVAAKRGRGPLVGVGCFLAAIFPVMGFFDIYYFRYTFYCDHFNYISAMALIAVLVALAAAIMRRSVPGAATPVGVTCGALLVSGLSVLTWMHQPDYFTTEGLYRATLKVNPTASMARTNLGVMMAQRARSREEFEAAMQEYRTVLDHNPRWDDAHTNLGDALATLGKLDEAAEHFRAALEINPDSFQARNNLGTIYADKKQPEQAIPEYEAALKINPRYPEAHNNLGVALSGLGRDSEAEPHFRSAVELRPTYSKARFRLAKLLSRSNRLDEAIEQFRKLLQFAPDYVEAHQELGVIFASQGKLEDAERHLAEWVRLRPGEKRARDALASIQSARAAAAPGQTTIIARSESAPPPAADPATAANAEEAYTQGSVLVGQNRFEEALPFLAEALKSDPTHAGAHNNVGIALAGLGRREEALDHLAEAVRLKPDFAEAHSNLGAALTSFGRYDEAITHCAQATQLKPEYAEAHHYLADALSAAGRKVEAAVQYGEALRLRPGWPVSAISLARILATHPDDEVRDGAQALYLAEEVCRLPQNQTPSTLDTLAVALAEVGRFDEAMTTAEKAMRMAQEAGQLELMRRIEGHWKLYQARQALREE